MSDEKVAPDGMLTAHVVDPDGVAPVAFWTESSSATNAEPLTLRPGATLEIAGRSFTVEELLRSWRPSEVAEAITFGEWSEDDLPDED